MTVALVLGTFLVVGLIAAAMIAITSSGTEPAARATEAAPDATEESEALASANGRAA